MWRNASVNGRSREERAEVVSPNRVQTEECGSCRRERVTPPPMIPPARTGVDIIAQAPRM
jgi:hypothetical protein